jgi:uncharacterized protein
VSGLLLRPENARACFVFAHGAGAGMTHPFMDAFATELAGEGIGSMRYQFPYMEHRARRPDPPQLAQATVRTAVHEARRRASALTLITGGKSFGGRMTSQAQALGPLPNVRGLVFFAFPLHLAGKPSSERAAHLADVDIPMLFLSGSNDALATLDLLRPVIAKLGERATLRLLDSADHSFHVSVKSGRTDAEVLAKALDAAVAWMTR